MMESRSYTILYFKHNANVKDDLTDIDIENTLITVLHHTIYTI